MKKIKKDQFEAFKVPILSERFHPFNISSIAPAIILFMILFLIIPYFNVEGTIYYKNIILYLKIYKIILAILIIMWLVFLNKKLAIKYQKIQFITWVIEAVALAVGIVYFGLTTIAKEIRPSLELFSNLKSAVLIVGAIVFVISFIVILNRIKNNYYVATIDELGNKVIKERSLMNANRRSIISLFVGLGLIINRLGLPLNFYVFLMFLLILGSWLMLMMVPSFIIIAYCKFKYKDFNVDK